MKTPLDALARLRARQQDDAEKNLADVMMRERAAREVREAAEREICDQQIVASSASFDDDLVEAFINWLPHGRRAVTEAMKKETEAALDVAVAREALVAARAARRAVEALLEKREAEEREAELRAEQKQLDDLPRCPSFL